MANKWHLYSRDNFLWRLNQGNSYLITIQLINFINSQVSERNARKTFIACPMFFSSYIHICITFSGNLFFVFLASNVKSALELNAMPPSGASDLSNSSPLLFQK